MRDFVSGIFPLNLYPDPLARFRAAATYALAVFVLFCVAVNALFNSLARSGANPQMETATNIANVVLPLAVIIAVALTRSGYQLAGAVPVVLGWFIPSWYLVYNLPDSVWLGMILMLIGITLCGVLVNERALIAVTAVSIVILVASAQLTAGGPTQTVIENRLLYSLALVLQASVTYALAHSIPRVVRQVAAESASRRLRLAEASTTITQRLLATRLDLDALLSETVMLVRGISTDVDDVQIFLVDPDRRNATLLASTRQHAATPIGEKIGIGSLSVIGRVTITGQTIIVRDTTEERAYRRTAFLEGTRAELALPLRVGTETVGVLDVQSHSPAAFPPDDVETLETLSNQIAIVVDNARLYAEAQNQITENKRLFDQTRNSLREIERLNRQLTGSAWSEYLRSQAVTPAYTVDLQSGQVEQVADWTPAMAEASQRNQITFRQHGQTRLMSLPISVRGQSIGAMEFELSAEQEVSTEQMSVLQQIIERLGLAIENSRLFEETQRIAQREALVNEISSRMQVTTNVEAVVAAATQSLADAFSAGHVAIRLGTPRETEAASD